MPELQFTLLDIIKNSDSKKVVEFFGKIEDKIGIDNFKILIPAILTDSDSCMSDIDRITISKITGEERYKFLFYCNP